MGLQEASGIFANAFLHMLSNPSASIQVVFVYNWFDLLFTRRSLDFLESDSSSVSRRFWFWYLGHTGRPNMCFRLLETWTVELLDEFGVTVLFVFKTSPLSFLDLEYSGRRQALPLLVDCAQELLLFLS